MKIYGVTLISSEGDFRVTKTDGTGTEANPFCESVTKLFSSQEDATNYAASEMKKTFEASDFENGEDNNGTTEEDLIYDIMYARDTHFQTPSSHVTCEFFSQDIGTDKLSDKEVNENEELLRKNAEEVSKAFNGKLSDIKLYDEENRNRIFKVRERAAAEAFELRDWLCACECGGLKAEPTISRTEARHCDEFSLIKICYHYSETCGYADSPYHTGYNREDEYADVYQVDKDMNITCLAGEESRDSIGLNDVFLINTRYVTLDQDLREVKETKTKVEPVGGDYGTDKISQFKEEFRLRLENSSSSSPLVTLINDIDNLLTNSGRYDILHISERTICLKNTKDENYFEITTSQYNN